MESKRFRRSVAMLCVVVVLCLLNAFKIINNSNIRSVDMLSLIALGMGIGALIAITSVYLASRRNA